MLFEHEEDEAKSAEDELVRLEFNQQVSEVTNLCQDMGAFKKTSLLSQTIQESLKAVEDLMAADATTDCSACMPDIQKQLDEMSLLLRDSTIKSTDGMWMTLKLLNARMLKAKSQKKADRAPVTIIKSEYDRDFDIPKVNIPKFKGGLEAWYAFWSRYKAAVNDNTKLSEPVKMAILIDLVADPALHDYLVAANDGEEGRYKQTIDYLKNRFDRPRELHQIYCKQLIDLPPIKGSTAEHSQAADAVFAAVAGIRRSGQAGIDSIATSLVVSTLPTQLRMEWENKTEEDPLVPHIDQWIAFVRKKATTASQSQKPSAYPSTRPPKENKRPHKPYVKSEGKVYVNHSEPAAVVEPNPPKPKSKSSKTTPNSCKTSCSLCSSLHFIFQCRQFQSSREEVMSSLPLCVSTACILATVFKTVNAVIDAGCARSSTTPSSTQMLAQSPVL